MNRGSRRQMIHRLTTLRPDATAETAISLWKQVATQVTSVVGEGGFDSLYARSLFLAQTEYPWLSADDSLAQAEPRFTSLRTSLQNQTPATASDANALLLTTLTDLLASLIGDPLTARILESAWGSDPQEGDNKEPEHD